jgi:hypothetical protein
MLQLISNYISSSKTIYLSGHTRKRLHLEQWAYRKQFLPEKGIFPNVKAWDNGTLHKENPYISPRFKIFKIFKRHCILEVSE